MRTLHFSKISDQWQCHPFHQWRYVIIKRWLKGYVAYFNEMSIGTGTRLNEMKQICREHLAGHYPK